MGKYQKPVERETDDKPKRPEACGNPYCLSHKDKLTGAYKPGFADVAIHLDGYTIYRCQRCYLEQIERNQRSQMAPITKGRMYFNMDDVRAHWETIREA